MSDSPMIIPETSDDYALMRGIADGNPAALKLLYDRHAPAVYALALRMIKDPSDADQLLTDVFFEIWTARARYDELRANPLTYLMRLTRSRAIDRLRRKSPFTGNVTLNPAEGIDIAISDDPSSPAQAAESRTIIAKALKNLDPDQRAAIECAYYEGLSHSQIAEKLQKPLGTIKSCIRLGLVRLRELLDSAFQEKGTA